LAIAQQTPSGQQSPPGQHEFAAAQQAPSGQQSPPGQQDGAFAAELVLLFVQQAAPASQQGRPFTQQSSVTQSHGQQPG